MARLRRTRKNNTDFVTKLQNKIFYAINIIDRGILNMRQEYTVVYKMRLTNDKSI